MRRFFAMGFLLLALSPACSKENVVTQNTNVAGGDQCSGTDDKGCGVGAVCVLGKCRSGCTNDAECPTGSICVGNRAPFGCTTPEEGACSASSPCPTGLVCGVDHVCRIPCDPLKENACPRNEQICAAGGMCLGKSEKDFARWICDSSGPGDSAYQFQPAIYYRDGQKNTCDIDTVGWSVPDSCGEERAYADVFEARALPVSDESVSIEPTHFVCPRRDACPSGRYFCSTADKAACASDPACAACAVKAAFSPPFACKPSASTLPKVCHCIEEDVLPCGLEKESTFKYIVPRLPGTDCTLQLPDAIKYKTTGYVMQLSREKPLLVSADRVLAAGTDYTIDAGGKITLTPEACKLSTLTTYVCQGKCAGGTCTDVVEH